MDYLNTYQNTYPDAVALFFLLLLYYIVRQTRTETRSNRRYQRLALCVILATAADIVWHALFAVHDTYSLPGAWLHIVTGNLFTAVSTYYVLTYLAAYLEKQERFASYCRICKCLLYVYAILLAFSYFPLRDYALYARLTGKELISDRGVMTALYVLPAVAIGVAISQLLHGKRPGRGGHAGRTLRTFIAVSLILVTAVILQALFQEVRSNFFFLALSLYILYLRIETPDYVQLQATLERLKKAEARAQDANRKKSDFLTDMSHEMRTPVNTMLGMNEMILRESLDEATLRYASQIRNAGDTLLETVDTILDFSKIETGTTEILPVRYELSSTINDLVNTVTPKIREKGLVFETEVDPAIPHLLFGDEIRIKQIIQNLLSNAVKYTAQGSVRLTVGYEPQPDQAILLKVSVTDTGIGIREEDMARLFSPYERLEELRNREVEGTGLGMNIVKKLLAMMDSRILVQSVYGKGSTFSFAIRQTVIDEKGIGEFKRFDRNVTPEEIYEEQFHAPDAKVLVVDDTPLNLSVVEGLLKYTLLQIDTVQSGMEALEIAKRVPYDVLFIDHRMPQMDGIETLDRLREDAESVNQKTPAIALTANAVAGAREMYLAAGFQDYLSKPLDGMQLEHLLLEYLPGEKVVRRQDPDFVPLPRQTKAPAQADAADGMIARLRGIDTAAGIRNSGGRDIFLGAVRDFYDTIAESADAIEACMETEDVKGFTIHVHALKSSARIIGALHLSEDAAYLEKCGDEEDLGEIRLKAPALLERLRRYSEELSAIVSEEREDADKPEISEDELQDAYEAIRSFAEAFDFDSIDRLTDSLSEYAIPAQERERFERVRLLAVNVDRDGLLEIL